MSAVELIVVLVVLTAAIVVVLKYLSHREQTQTQPPDRTTYIEGLKALLQGQDEQAFTKLKETVNTDTNNVDAYIRLGSIFRRRKKAEQAVQVHRDLTFRHFLSNDEKREILVALYYDFLELKDDASAIKAIREVLESNANDHFALTVLLRHHEKSGEWKEAGSVRQKLDKLESQDSSRVLALYKLFEGEELISQGDPHRARLFFKEAINLDKICLAAYIAVADSYYNEGRLEDALRYWTKIISLKPDMGQLVFDRLKRGFFEVGRYGEYADTLTSILQIHPNHLTARLELAYFMENKGDVDTAREYYSAAVDAHPDSLLAKLGSYRLNRSLGKKEIAEAMLKQIIKMAIKREAGNFRCKECGLDSENMTWLCPRCKAVDSFEPVKS